MYVRRATPQDADGFAAVMASVAEEDRWIATEPPVDLQRLRERVRKILDDGGPIVGTLGLHGTRVDGVVMLGMAILAEHRGHGGGRALMQAALEHARGAPW